MRKEHRCLEMTAYAEREELQEISIQHYELGGWELSWVSSGFDGRHNIDEINFCPYCGANLNHEPN